MRGPIARAIFGMDALEQAEIDAKLIELDGTPNMSKLGGNATVAVSLAVAQAGALAFDMPLWQYLADDGPVSLPMPEVQIFGGGAHAGRRIDIQDLMVMPVGAWTFDDAITMVRGDLPRRRDCSCRKRASSPAWPTKAAGGRSSRATRKRSR